MSNDVRTALGTHEFFIGMKPRHLDAIATLGTWSDHPAHSWMACAGDAADRFHAIVSGRAGIEIASPGRDPLIVATVHQGDVVGWSWFIDGQPWQFDVIALDDVRSVAIDVARLVDAYDDDQELRHELSSRLLRVVASRLKATRLQLVDVYGNAR
jgi:CRP-like cAMP-binding protein